ncbi:hypothetical protein QJS10_CPB11g00875 [Acorus calamus]|uniref:Uncharacterized protein n=1 Tax=Acorus calamus TaxID=4465 RepID=A0AAV9DV99_ACOCL|nr:hypothetical protein QJS10_CPB11g00875 [Acorus calamus]
MWGCYVKSLKALSSLQATVTNFAMNFLSLGLAGLFLFEESLSSKPMVGLPKGPMHASMQGPKDVSTNE